MATGSITARTDRTIGGRITDVASAEGAAFIFGALAFFVGSGVLTRSGQPGASTPVPWMSSHALWVVATASVAIGTVRLVRSSGLRAGVAGYAASGLVGLGVLHTLQWTTWVYVDVIAYRQGAHEFLLPSLLHPFGTGHVFTFAIVVGSAVATLAWTTRRTDATGRSISWLGVAIGVASVLAGTASLLTFAPVRSPGSLAAIVLQAGNFAWLFLLGVALAHGPGREGSS